MTKRKNILSIILIIIVTMLIGTGVSICAGKIIGSSDKYAKVEGKISYYDMDKDIFGTEYSTYSTYYYNGEEHADIFSGKTSEQPTLNSTIHLFVNKSDGSLDTTVQDMPYAIGGIVWIVSMIILFSIKKAKTRKMKLATADLSNLNKETKSVVSNMLNDAHTVTLNTTAKTSTESIPEK